MAENALEPRPFRLELKGISKSFDGVPVLHGVDLSVSPGEIHALCGENGAGKSTLMKILSGVYPRDEFAGEILIDGHPCDFRSVRDAETAGVSIIFQELSLLENLSIAENISLACEPTRWGVVHEAAMKREAREALNELGVDLDPDLLVGDLGVGQKQLVEIAKALRKRSRILILDEPTSALSEIETAQLLKVVKRLAVRGLSSLLISHKLEEVVAVSDTVSVLRDGRKISTAPISECTPSRIVAEMVGRTLTQLYPYRPRPLGDVVLKVTDWTVPRAKTPGRPSVEGLSLELRRGEILGLSGLMGAGRTELLMSLVGEGPRSTRGQVWVSGREYRPVSPGDALERGIALIPEDRKRLGLLLDQSVTVNLTLATLRHHVRRGLVSSPSERAAAQTVGERLRIKSASGEAPVRTLSGGNQQKVVMGRFLLTESPILLLDEPTRGIDVGAKAEIYEFLMDWTAKGYSCLLASSELPEVLGICDRVLVMAHGRCTGEFDRATATPKRIMECAVSDQGPAERRV